MLKNLRYLTHLTMNVVESHMNTLSICKELIKQTYHNKSVLKDPLYTEVLNLQLQWRCKVNCDETL